MSAFALVVDFDGALIEPAMLDRGERALAGFGRLGWQRHGGPGFAFSQAVPATGHGNAAVSRIHVVLDGRLTEGCAGRLATLLELSPDERARHGDAELIARSCSERGNVQATLAALEGDYVLAVIDSAAASLHLARSVIGSRALHHVQSGRQIVVATRAAAALRTAGLELRERAESIAAYFALRAPAAGANYFEGLATVAPGHLQLWQAGRLCDSTIASRSDTQPLEFASIEDAAQAWAAVLHSATAEALRGSARAGVMLSGGIDSNLLAMCAAASSPNLLACSWRLPATPSADEGGWIGQATESLGLSAISLDGSQLHPLAGIDRWSVEDDGPPSNPYQNLHEQLYARASEQGCDVLLSGNFGDHLYPDAARWLPAALTDRGLGWVLRRYCAEWCSLGATAIWRDPGWRTMVRGLLRRPAKSWGPPDWMQARWRSELVDWLGVSLPDTGPCSPEASADAELGRRLPARSGIELRAPYRDPRVIEFASRLPAHYQYREGQQKFLSRRLLRQRLPDSLCTRPKGGNLGAFFRLGVFDRAAAVVANLLDAPDARWPRYVERAALGRARDRRQDESDLLLIWLSVSYELWWRAHWDTGPAVLSSEAS